jgi:hypothetical protein
MDGSTTKFKVQFVALGFQQYAWEDFNEHFN